MFRISSVLNGLWQALSQDRRPLGILLGAGCPASVRGEDGQPLVPTLVGLTQAVCETVSEGDCADSLVILEKSLKSDLEGDQTVEDMLTRLRTLEQVAGSEAVRGLSHDAIVALEATLAVTIGQTVSVDLPAGLTPFDHLARWAGGIDRKVPLQFFTTNYDLLLEQALERAEVPYFDGFVGRRRPFLDSQTIDRDDLPVRWARLWKLHGSVNWERQGAQVRHGDQADGFVPMIHPSHLKYEQSRRMPYLVMQDRLRMFLQEPSATLVICGYSFADQHINESLAHGLKVNPSASVFGLLYGAAARYGHAFEIASKHPNLVLISEDHASSGRKSGKWQAENGEDETCDLGDFAIFGAGLEALVRDRVPVVEQEAT